MFPDLKFIKMENRLNFNLLKTDARTKKRILRVWRALLTVENNSKEIVDGLFAIYSVLRENNETSQTIKPHPATTQKSPKESFQENWLDKQDVMRILHVSESTLYLMRRDNVLPYFKMRGKIYYRLQDVELAMRRKGA